MVHTFVFFQETVTYPRLQKCSVSSVSFLVLVVIFRSMIHFEVIFEYIVKQGVFLF